MEKKSDLKNVVIIPKEHVLFIPRNMYFSPDEDEKYLVTELNLTKKDYWQKKKINALGKFYLDCRKKLKGEEFINVFEVSLDSTKLLIYNPYSFANVENIDNSLKTKMINHAKDTIDLCQMSNIVWIFEQKQGWLPLIIQKNRMITDNSVFLNDVFYKKTNGKEYLMFLGNTLKGQGSGANIKQVFVFNLKNFNNYFYKEFDKNFSPDLINDFNNDGELEIIKFNYKPIFKNDDL